MITVRPARARGHADHGWLDSRHTFSFGNFHDPDHMGFGPLRVINEDRVEPGAGFATHGHRDMEILSVVLDGALEHKDSLGTGSVIRPGDVQRMTAGSGIRHSEFNHSADQPVHFLQIWLLPERAGLAPGYEQKRFADADKHNTLRLIAARDGRDGALTVHQDAAIYAALIDDTATLTHPLAADRKAWVQVARGTVAVNGHELKAGDGAAIAGESGLSLIGRAARSDILLFDLPAL